AIGAEDEDEPLFASPRSGGRPSEARQPHHQIGGGGADAGANQKIASGWVVAHRSGILFFDVTWAHRRDDGDLDQQLTYVQAAGLKTLSQFIERISTVGGRRLFDKVFKCTGDKRTVRILVSREEIGQLA